MFIISKDFTTLRYDRQNYIIEQNKPKPND